MIQLNRFVDGFVLSVAAAALGLAGCGADAGSGLPAQQPPLVTPVAGTSAVAAPKPVVVTPPPGPLQTGTAGVGAPAIKPPPVVATAGTAATTPVMPLPNPAVGGAPAPAATGGAAAPAAPGAPWDPMASLDANGKLKVPAPADGFQWATPMFSLAPGQEVFNCYHVAVPSDTEFPVGEWDSQMAPGSHHFILYRTAGDPAAENTLVNGACTQGFGGTTWLYTAGSPRGHLQFPDNVAMTLSAKERVTFDLHYINTTSQMLPVVVALNVNKVKGTNFHKADAQISFNFGINVPPHGTQTVQGDCTPVAGAKYFLMQTHSHKYTTKAVVNRKMANGQLGEVLAMTTDWEKPDQRLWPAAPFLTFQQGESFHYACSYKNDTANTITVGISAELNEMCMAEAYFFPASAGTPMCN